ncbi:histidine kinase [Janibacter sp. DB-40]|uniref:sensor histidine kinase n=1 Tax=Janibacter sp. DB-40 TaxID=3028808 RepID=UPI002406A781|nr:histidine kinase [Janibacter sp. DB-40]
MVDVHGIPRLLVTVTQTAFVVRLVGLLAALVLVMGRELTPAILVGVVAAGLTSYVGLARPEYLRMVSRHPSIALVDLAIMATAVAFAGADSPLVLVLLPTALLLGLWVDRIAGAIVIVCLLGVYVFALQATTFAGQGSFLVTAILPFVFIVLWLLGMVVARAVEGERRAQASVRDAIASAAAAGERTAIAREIHDSMAKSLQGIVMTSAALPTLVERNPTGAREQAQELQGMASQAVHQMRQIMTSLRERSADQSLSSAVAEVVMAWQVATGRQVELSVRENLDTEDDAVRYELVHCVTEALDNVRRHAGPCRVVVSLAREDPDRLVLRIADDGVGMNHTAVESAARAGHHGVSGIRERMARIGGLAEVISAEGEGTTLELSIHREGLIER